MAIHSEINRSRGRHSCKTRNPGKNWIPGQALNDRPERTYVVMANSAKGVDVFLELAEGFHLAGTSSGSRESSTRQIKNSSSVSLC